MNKYDIPFHKYVYLWLLLLLSTAMTGAQFYSFHEGDEVIMTFRYDKAQVSGHAIEIRRANRPPFYINGHISHDGLTDDEVGRFNVMEQEEADPKIDKKIILVKITNVTRSDGGTYICSVFKNGMFVYGSRHRIGLTVNYPPGKASCHFVDDASEIDEEWTKIKCTAPRGNYFGFIHCYQLEGRMPHYTHVTHNNTHIMQGLIVRRNKPVMCCTISYKRLITECACNDFLWDPLNQNLTTLCPKEKADFGAVITNPFMRSDHMSSSVATLTQQQKNFSTEAFHTQNQCTCSDVRAIWFITGGLVSTAIMAAVWFACHMKNIKYMSSNAKQSTGKDHHKSTASENNIATEEQPTHVEVRKKNKFTKSRQKLTPEYKNEEGQFRQVGSTFQTL